MRGLTLPRRQPLSSVPGGHAHEPSRNVEETLIDDKQVAAVKPRPELAGFSRPTMNSEQAFHMHVVLADPTGIEYASTTQKRKPWPITVSYTLHSQATSLS